MEITQTPFAQMLAPEAAAQAEIPAADAFAAALAAATNGVPPGTGGPEPPGVPTIVGEEAANLEPNALSQKPDFLPLPDLTIEMPAEFWTPAEPQTETEVAPQEDQPDLAAQETAASVFVLVPPAPPAPALPTVNTSPNMAPAELAIQATTSSIATMVPPPVVDRERQAESKAPDVRFVPTVDVTDQPQPAKSDQPTLTVQAGDRITVETQRSFNRPAPTLAAANTAVQLVEQQSSTPDSVMTEQAVAEPQTVVTEAPKGTASNVGGKKSTLDVEVAKQQASSPKIATPTGSSSGQPSDGMPDRGDDGQKADVKAPSAKTDTDPTATVAPATKSALTTEAPAKTEPLSRADRDSVIRQIGDRMELLAATRPRDGVTIHLQPANMGSITMVVKSIGAAIDAQIFASNDDVRASLEGSRPELARAMDARGFNLQNVTVAAQTADHRQFDSQTRPDLRQQQQQQGQAPTHRQHQQSSARGDSFARPLDEPADNRPALVSGHGVDLWI